MGACGSKNDENEIQSSFDPKNIYYDINGNLRYGIVLNDIVEEMRRMIVNDSLQEVHQTWHIIDSSWFSSWLYFAHYDKYVSPCPGPCRNDDLITYDHSLQMWVPRKNLVLAAKDRPGHYCKVNRETWQLFRECYEHSGPTITIEFDAKSKDQQNTLNWVIDQGECPDPPPVDEFDQAPEEFEEDVIKKEITSFPSTKPVQTTKKKDVSRHPAPPPSEFNMEDNAIKRNTLQEIQSFFGITEPSDSSLNPNGTFEHKYSPTLMNSRSDSNSQTEAPPKDANEAVSIWLFGENNLLP